jgi:hypothetical protein
MGKRLTVILGAGASYDSTPIAVGEIDKSYTPPLTSQIFEGRKPFQRILEKYPKARALASTIAVKVQRGESLEAVLRDLRDSQEEHIVKEFIQVPLYLQELFWEVSFRYTSEFVNYTNLVSRLLYSDIEQVVFVSLNYDLLLEKSLGTIISGSGTRWQPVDLSFYYDPNRKWQLIKLHGSVNWVRLVRRLGSIDWTDETVLDRLDSLGLQLDNSLDPNINVVSGYQQRWIKRAGSKLVCYPAITVPVEGKYEFVCPSEHIVILKEFLDSCRNFLIIGASGRDRDLLDILKDNVQDCTVLGIVDFGADQVRNVFDRFSSRVLQFYVPRVKRLYSEGFSKFILAGEDSLDEFLSELQT